MEPASQEKAVGEHAIFRCRYVSADSLTIRWRVNGVFVGRSPPPDITPDTERDVNGNLVDILTIRVSKEYNGTEVVCVAQFDNETLPNKSTHPARLTGTCMPVYKNCIHIHLCLVLYRV